MPLELHEVSSDVTLLVTHRGKPIPGIEIKIFRMKNSTPVFAGITREQGTVLHKPLAPGQYHVYVSHEGFDAPTEWIEVVTRAGKNVVARLDIKWADWSYETSRVRGTLSGLIPGHTGKRLMDIVHPVKTVYPGVAMSLKGAFSSDEYQTISDSSGEFVFPDVPPGVYVLSIAGGMESVAGTAGPTRQVIDVTASSSAASLPLNLRDTGCGGTGFQVAEN